MKVGTRPIVLILLAVMAMAPVLALFKFVWYHSGNENFAGNLSAGMDSDEGELWFANYDAASPDARVMSVYRVDTNSWMTFSGGPGGIPLAIFRFVDVGESKVVTGGSDGAAVYDRTTGKWSSYNVENGTPSKDFYSGTTKGDEIWFGTNKGIARVDGSGNWAYYTVDDGLPNDKILAMLFDGDILWVCTDGGAARFDTGSGQISKYTEAEGMPGEVVMQALVDGDYVWFATKGGAARLDKNTNEIKAYTMADGLLSDELKDVEVLGDKIYFATNRGVAYTSRTKEGKWRQITTKQGLPETAVRAGKGSDASHLAVQGDELWIALWYEGLVRMSIPTGLAIIPYWVWIVALAVVGIVALIVIRPGAKKGEVSEKEKMVRERREKAKAEKPPFEICGGVPQRKLCNRCKFNTLRAGKLFCGKYQIPIEYKKAP